MIIPNIWKNNEKYKMVQTTNQLWFDTMVSSFDHSDLKADCLQHPWVNLALMKASIPLEEEQVLSGNLT